MNILPGLEKFSHLEDKIFLTVEYLKKLRDENERLDAEVKKLQESVQNLTTERTGLKKKLDVLLSERDAVQLRVESND